LAIRERDVLLDRFKLVRLRGRGGMGEVWEARDLRLHASVALKTVRAPGTPSPELLDRLRREVQLARAVTHPGVCRVFDLHEGPGPGGAPVAFVTMELLEGTSLAERLRETGPFPSAEALRLLRQIAGGLAAVHAAGLVHRDVKPGNVMLVADGERLRAAVTDLGIARAVAPDRHASGWDGTEAAGARDVAVGWNGTVLTRP
jgi:serine/threonine-protein kinase